MADIEALKRQIRDNIRSNGRQDISGDMLQTYMIGILDAFPQNEIKTIAFSDLDGMTNPFADTGVYNITFNGTDSIGTLWSMKPWGNRNLFQVVLTPSSADDLNSRGTGVPTQHYGEMFLCMRYNTSSTPGVWSKWKDMITKDNEIKTTRFDEIDGLTNPFTDTGAYNIVHNEIDSIGTLWAMKPWGNRNILQVILSPSDAEGLNSRGEGLPAQWYNQMFLCMRYNTANNPDVWSDWQDMSSQTTVIDNLNSTSTTSALSAAQGKALNEKKANKTDLSEYAYAPNMPWELIDPNTLEINQVDDAGNIAIYWKQKDLERKEKENALNLPVATTSLNGIMSTADKSKLDGMPASVYSKGEVDKHLNAKANNGDVYTKAQADAAITSKLVGVYKSQGNKVQFSDLTTADQVAGYVFNILTPFTLDGEEYPAGSNVVWTAEDELRPAHWDVLGGFIDLTPYAKVANLPSKILSGNGTVDNSSSTEVVLRMERADPATGDTVDSNFTIEQASSEFAGVMSASDKVKLDNTLVVDVHLDIAKLSKGVFTKESLGYSFDEIFNSAEARRTIGYTNDGYKGIFNSQKYYRNSDQAKKVVELGAVTVTDEVEQNNPSAYIIYVMMEKVESTGVSSVVRLNKIELARKESLIIK